MNFKVKDRLFCPTLYYLDPDHHVEVTLRVLLNDVPDVVGFPGLLELATGHKVLDLADRSDRVLVRVCQTKTQIPCVTEIMSVT